ncbi:MAG: hypothetical protein O3A00_27450 [Planctomycetota bacterium]|nr:hypothetical protein [Planctomycetota bacterium]
MSLKQRLQNPQATDSSIVCAVLACGCALIYAVSPKHGIAVVAAFTGFGVLIFSLVGCLAGAVTTLMSRKSRISGLIGFALSAVAVVALYFLPKSKIFFRAIGFE